MNDKRGTAAEYAAWVWLSIEMLEAMAPEAIELAARVTRALELSVAQGRLAGGGAMCDARFGGGRRLYKGELFFLWALAVGNVGSQGEQQAPADANGRVVQGKIVAAGGAPVTDAKVLFGQSDLGTALVEGARAATDAQGAYRADLGAFAWSTGRIRAVVLAPGYKAADKKLEPGKATTTADFELVAEPWKQTQVRLENASGKPVADEAIICALGGATWEKYKTDALGRCLIGMARDQPMSLSIEPKSGRPVVAYLAGTKDDPPTITLQVLPAIRGRVIDSEGRPVPNAAVGRWLIVGTDGSGEMLPFFGGAIAATDAEGSFAIAPRLYLRLYMSRPVPKLEALLFADPSYRQESYQLFHPGQPIRMAYQLFDPSRQVEPMTVKLKPSRRVRIPISRGFEPSKRKTQLHSEVSIQPDKDIPDWRLTLINRDIAAAGESSGETSETVIEESLPEGTYHLEVRLADQESDETFGKAHREIVVPPGAGLLELPAFALEPPGFQKLVGKPAPEIDAIDLDSGRAVTLADFRGKVVVLDFWGYWCGPCVGNMPHLVELNRKYAGRPLAIVALHDQSVQSRAEYDRRIASARTRIWAGRDLPFHVLLDRADPMKPDGLDPEGTGTTTKRYGIRGFPTLFVIDRDGTMIGQVDATNHDRLESVVRELLEKADKNAR